MKSQNVCDCGGPWFLQHLSFFTNHLKLVNWIPGHVAEGALYRFHTTHLTILTDLQSVLITYVFGKSLPKTSSEVSVIRSNWKLKAMLFFRIFCLYVQTMPSYHNFTAFTKNSLVQIWVAPKIKMNEIWFFMYLFYVK